MILIVATITTTTTALIFWYRSAIFKHAFDSLEKKHMECVKYYGKEVKDRDNSIHRLEHAFKSCAKRIPLEDLDIVELSNKLIRGEFDARIKGFMDLDGCSFQEAANRAMTHFKYQIPRTNEEESE